MAELVDALASGASVRKDVEVQVLFRPPKLLNSLSNFFIFGKFANAKTARG